MKKYFMVLGIFVFTHQGCSFAGPEKAQAVVEPTQQGSTVSGSVFFEEASDGLHVMADFKGLPPGKHGFHIHEKGSCEDGGKAAGSHYNPAGAPHGLLTKDGLHGAHAGDFGNVEAGPDGSAKMSAVLPGISLKNGQYNVAGLALILHEKEDDFGQPTGNAGGRIGCGIIKVVE